MYILIYDKREKCLLLSTQADTWTDVHKTHGQKYRQKKRRADRQTRRADRKTVRQKDCQTERRAERKIY